MSTHQLQRTFGSSMTTSLFLPHRIRVAMRTLGSDGPTGGDDGIVEIDETFFGNKPGVEIKGGYRISLPANEEINVVDPKPQENCTQSQRCINLTLVISVSNKQANFDRFVTEILMAPTLPSMGDRLTSSKKVK